ncbi:hypothetical protein HDU96_001971 [Phlyctochytrium bullatum]|nr:hypothetical protein HDU96_001971 [Phlyctochytrium bullatum]
MTTTATAVNIASALEEASPPTREDSEQQQQHGLMADASPAHHQDTKAIIIPILIDDDTTTSPHDHSCAQSTTSSTPRTPSTPLLLPQGSVDSDSCFLSPVGDSAITLLMMKRADKQQPCDDSDPDVEIVDNVFAPQPAACVSETLAPGSEQGFRSSPLGGAGLQSGAAGGANDVVLSPLAQIACHVILRLMAQRWKSSHLSQGAVPASDFFDGALPTSFPDASQPHQQQQQGNLTVHLLRLKRFASIALRHSRPSTPHLLMHALLLVHRIVSNPAPLPPSLGSPTRLLLAGLMLSEAHLSDTQTSAAVWARVAAIPEGARGVATVKRDALEVLAYGVGVKEDEYSAWVRAVKKCFDKSSALPCHPTRASAAAASAPVTPPPTFSDAAAPLFDPTRTTAVIIPGAAPAAHDAQPDPDQAVAAAAAAAAAAAVAMAAVSSLPASMVTQALKRHRHPPAPQPPVSRSYVEAMDGATIAAARSTVEMIAAVRRARALLAEAKLRAARGDAEGAQQTQQSAERAAAAVAAAMGAAAAMRKKRGSAADAPEDTRRAVRQRVDDAAVVPVTGPAPVEEVCTCGMAVATPRGPPKVVAKCKLHKRLFAARRPVATEEQQFSPPPKHPNCVGRDAEADGMGSVWMKTVLVDDV